MDSYCRRPNVENVAGRRQRNGSREASLTLVGGLLRVHFGLSKAYVLPGRRKEILPGGLALGHDRSSPNHKRQDPLGI